MTLHKKQIIFFSLLYAILRVFSYFFSPETPLYAANPTNTVVSLIILLAAVCFLWRKDDRGWYIIALEMILGGAGGFFAVGEISLRTLLLGTSLLIYSVQQISNFKFQISNARRFLFPLILIIWTVVSALRGYFAGHNLSLIISDTIPYLFFLYYFPLRELLQSERFRQIGFNALVAAIIGNFLLIIYTFIGYSSGIFVLQDSYYHWYRDVALGKITELPFHFYRLVLNEHLLLIPILLYFLCSIIQNNRNKKIIFVICYLLFVILTINLTRIYLLALAVGTLALFTRQNWKRWLAISFVSCFLFLVSFTSIHLVASRGQSLGWEIFGIRLQSIVSPSVEESSLSRLLLLPKIIEKIKQNPVLGSGLGDTVTVYSPIFKTDITTAHFDWGYLEILAEMGLVGLLVWLSFITYLLSRLKKIYCAEAKFYLASFFALLTINLTSPALFHVMGVVWVTILSAIAYFLPKTKNEIS